MLYTCHHYGSLNTEPRIASYLGIAFGQIPATHYFKMASTFPPTCDWDFSPSNNPSGGYREYGVDAIGLNPDGYAPNNDNTLVDYGFGDCRPAQPLPPPEAHTNGVVTPHALFLALPYTRRAALDNLDRLRRDFDVHGEGGLFDAVNVDSGQVSRYWLALDQGMVMAALGNEPIGDRLQRYLTRGAVERAVRPLLAVEEFTAGG